MDGLTLKQLRYFEAVARHGHFGRAAEASSVSQPAISVQIRELEDSLGQVLFERGARQVRLTAFGETFAPRVRHILRAIDDLSDLARTSAERLVGKLRLGVIPTIGPYLLPQVLRGLARDFPEADLSIRETQTDTLIRDVQNGRLDAALLALPISEPGLVETRLFDEDFVLVRERSDADRPVPTGQSLSQMRLLLLEEGHCFRDQALDLCGPVSARNNDNMEASSLATLVQMVASGMGVTLLPEMAVDLETVGAKVNVARFPTPRPTRTIGLIWRANSPLTSQLGAVAECIEASVRQQGSR